MATDAPSGTNSAIASRMERIFDICLTTLPFWLALFHKRLNAFLRVFGLHEFVEVNLFRPRQSFVEVHGVPRVNSFFGDAERSGTERRELAHSFVHNVFKLICGPGPPSQPGGSRIGAGNRASCKNQI